MHQIFGCSPTLARQYPPIKRVFGEGGARMMRKLVSIFFATLLLFLGPDLQTVSAQTATSSNDPITMTTVTRPPFSMPTDDGGDQGFSIELMNAIAVELGRGVIYDRRDGFIDMLNAVENGEVDGAIANISITADRERIFDFSQPIFRSGLQILVPMEASGNSIFNALMSRDLLLVLLTFVGILFLAGMFTWLVERGRQAYFDRPIKQALFPNFWWALNVVVNGGFEERMPQSALGRAFAVILVLSSLFTVSIFVATITSAITVQALSSSVNSISDLDGKQVGTTQGSTTATYLDDIQINYIQFPGLAELLEAFESGRLDAVVFDGPILSHYAQNEGAGLAQVLEPIYRPEDYGISLADGSDLREPINQALLTLQENGTYGLLVSKWFGN
ncbi:MAG: transporter substrate-binding domain-containing protein [Pseudomonadota bacterium]